jgi:hypothetical protein
MASGTWSPVGGADVGGTSPILFSSAASTAAVSSNIAIEWDFDNDGDFDQSVEDITSYVLAAQSMVGRDYPSNLTGRSAPGKLKLTLNNDDDRFSYFNTSSPLATDPFSLKTGRKIRVRATDASTGVASISYVGIGAFSSGDNVSLVPALPTGLADGDLMIIFATIRNSGTGTVDTPSGWANMLTSGNCTVLARYYETGDVAPTVSFTGGVAGATTTARCFAFRGCHPQLTRAFVNTASQLNATSATTIALPGMVATAKSWMVDPDAVTTVILGWRQDDATSIATLSGQFMTEISDSPATAGSDAHTEIQYRLGAFSGAKTFTATNFSITGGVTAISRGLGFQLAPAVAYADPVLLASDSFNRADGVPLVTDDLGNAWTNRATSPYYISNQRAKLDDGPSAVRTSVYQMSTVDTGTTDHYVQAQLSYPVQDGGLGLVARFADTSNYVRAYLDVPIPSIIVEERKAGVTTTLGEFFVESWEGMTLGLRVENQRVAVYLGGAPLHWDIGDGGEWLTLTNTITGTHAGLISYWAAHSDIPPQFDDFRVWDRVASAIPGRIWTGRVKSLKTGVKAGVLKTVEVECEGYLGGGASQPVPAPRITRDVGESYFVNSSVPSGCIVGDIMARAGLQEPPFPTTTYPVSFIGPVALKDGKALDLARQVELTERGFLKEVPEGGVTYEDRMVRTEKASLAWFTDTPGRGQYTFEECEPLDHEGRIINRAMAQVAAGSPTVVDVANQGDDDVSLDVLFVIPEVLPGDLVLVFVACSAVQSERQWFEPPGWKKLRDVGDDVGMRIFSLIADGSESGTSVYFLKTETQGTFIAHSYVIRDWYGTEDGIKLGRVSSGAIGGTNPYPVSPGWNRAPALYIVFQCAIGANTGILWDDLGTPPPVGYNYGSLEGLVFVTSPASLETGVESIYKRDVTDTEDPRAWDGVFTDYLVLETVAVAVRGYNGPLEKPTIDDSKATVGDGQIVVVEDFDSQQDHGFIRTNPDLPSLFYTAADARDWCDDVLEEFSDDRPVIALSFTASKNAALRGQAIDRRLSDKITVTATGNSGLGFEGDFFIENIHHAWSHGLKLWVTTWELSPA